MSGTAAVLQTGFRTSAISMILYTEGTRMTGTLLVLCRRRHMVNWWYDTKRHLNEWYIGDAIETGISSRATAVAMHTEVIRMRGTLSSCTQQLSVHEQKLRSAEVTSIYSAVRLRGSQIRRKQHKQ